MIKRIDRIISEQTNYSRKEIKKMISMGIVYANGKIINKWIINMMKTTLSSK